MDSEQVKEDFARESRRFARLVLPGQDPLVVFLKGHLLIEEQLALLVAAGIADPEPLEFARFTFSQKLHLAKGVAGKFFANDVYEAIRQLNSIRNKLAHQAEPTDIQQLVGAFLRWCDEQPRFRLQGIASTTSALHCALSTCWAYLTGVRDALRVVREHMPLPHHEEGK